MNQAGREAVLEHYRHPHGYGLIEGFPAHAGTNPGCADQISFQAGLQNGALWLHFEAQGCAVSRATASILTDVLEATSPATAKEILADFSAALQGQEGTLPQVLADLVAFVRSAHRENCALLPARLAAAALAEL
jgi:nitrogen fixation NifU-like protein